MAFRRHATSAHAGSAHQLRRTAIDYQDDRLRLAAHTCRDGADPVIVGHFVYHCHAGDQEDKGIMGVVEVVA